MTAWGALQPLTVGQFGSTQVYNTDITVGKSGNEVRNANWQDPLRKFNAAFNVKSYADIETIVTLFHAVKGREQSFLVKDYSDYKITRTNIGTGDGVDTTFQLVKKYVHSVIGTYTRTITKPKALEGVGGVRVWVNNVELDVADFSFSSVTGIITIPSAPANTHAVEASCDEFYVPVRFDTDELPIEMMNWWVEASGSDYANIQIPEIPLMEVRNE